MLTAPFKNRHLILLTAALFTAAAVHQSALGQPAPGPGTPTPPTTPGTPGTTPPTAGAGLTSGIAIDASGVLQRLTVADPSGRLARERARNALASLDADVSQQSRLRKVSLSRLSKLIDR